VIIFFLVWCGVVWCLCVCAYIWRIKKNNNKFYDEEEGGWSSTTNNNTKTMHLLCISYMSNPNANSIQSDQSDRSFFGVSLSSEDKVSKVLFRESHIPFFILFFSTQRKCLKLHLRKKHLLQMMML